MSKYPITKFERLIIDNRSVLLLFDTGEKEHVCNLLIDSPDAWVLGAWSSINEPLELVIGALYEMYDINKRRSNLLTPAEKMRDSLDNLVRIMELIKHPDGTYSQSRLNECSSILNQCWTTLIAEAGSNFLTTRLPHRSAVLKSAAQRKRPNPKSKLRERIKQLMIRERVEGNKFVDILSNWERTPIYDLALQYKKWEDTYLIIQLYDEDEDEDDEGALYTKKQLQRIFYEAREP